MFAPSLAATVLGCVMVISATSLLAGEIRRQRVVWLELAGVLGLALFALGFVGLLFETV